MPENLEESSHENSKGLFDVESMLLTHYPPEVLATYLATLEAMDTSIRLYLSNAPSVDERENHERFIHNLIAGAAIQGYEVRLNS